MPITKSKPTTTTAYYCNYENSPGRRSRAQPRPQPSPKRCRLPARAGLDTDDTGAGRAPPFQAPTAARGAPPGAHGGGPAGRGPAGGGGRTVFRLGRGRGGGVHGGAPLVRPWPLWGLRTARATPGRRRARAYSSASSTRSAAGTPLRSAAADTQSRGANGPWHRVRGRYPGGALGEPLRRVACATARTLVDW